MRYPFEPPDFEVGDYVRLVPPSPEAPAPGPCGHTPLQMWQEGDATSIKGMVITAEGTYNVSCTVCATDYQQEGVIVEIPGFFPCIASPWQLELVNAT